MGFHRSYTGLYGFCIASCMFILVFAGFVWVLTGFTLICISFAKTVIGFIHMKGTDSRINIRIQSKDAISSLRNARRVLRFSYKDKKEEASVGRGWSEKNLVDCRKANSVTPKGLTAQDLQAQYFQHHQYPPVY